MPVLNVSCQLSASQEQPLLAVTTRSHFQVKKSCYSLFCGLVDIFSWISHFLLLPASVSKGYCLKIFSRWQFQEKDTNFLSWMMLAYLLVLQSRETGATVSKNPFRFYFSVVPCEQDELKNIILH